MIRAVCFDAFGTICYFSLGRIILYDETPEVFNALKAQGYKVGVISNINKIYGNTLLKQLPFEPDCVSFPYLSGAVKPEPEAFAFACRKLGLEPAEILMVGDSYNNDYIGAREFGMNALYLDTRGYNKTIEAITNIKEVIDHEFLV